MRRSIRRPWVLVDFQTLLFWKLSMTRGCSRSLRKSRRSGRCWDTSIHGNRLPAPIPLGRPFEKYHHMGSRRASSDISIWTSALHETRKQYYCSQEHKVKKINNAQSVTCVHKLPLSHMSMIKKFTEPTSTQKCCPCDTCRLTNKLRARSSHDATKRKHQLPRSQLSAVERSTKVSGGRHF